MLPCIIKQIKEHINQSDYERKGCIQILADLLATLQGSGNLKVYILMI